MSSDFFKKILLYLTRVQENRVFIITSLYNLFFIDKEIYMKKSFVMITLASFLLAGCGSTNNSKVVDKGSNKVTYDFSSFNKVTPDIYTEESAKEVIKESTYNFVLLGANDAQKYLLSQIVNAHLTGIGYTVEDGIKEVLQGSGYTLCKVRPVEVFNLLRKPLPSVHYNFSSIKLQDALQVLAGSDFSLIANHKIREVCYKVKGKK